MKITKQKYNQIKTKADKLTLKELAKKYGVGVTTAWKVRNTDGYEEFQGLNYRYYQNSKYKDLIQPENLRRANFKVALIGVVIMAVAVLIVMVLILATATKPVEELENPYCQFKAPYKTKVLPTGRACE